MKKRNICIITGSRAEYGLLSKLMRLIEKSREINLQLIVTGMHLSTEFGLTYKEIIKDGFNIDHKIEMLLSADTATAISKSTGLGIISFSDALKDLKPELIILLGDRFEMLAASISALFNKIPIAHISGGESTVGAFDEAIRHSITKMSHLHFVSAKEYKKRVIQLGENPKNVYNVGGLGVDQILSTSLLNKKQLQKEINYEFGENNILVTFHPVTLDNESSEQQFGNLLSVLSEKNDLNIIFTKPNADTNGRVIIKMIDDFVSKHSNRSKSFISMGQKNYLSTLQFIDGVVGNSSSGIAEAPTFKIGTINIGDRQSGRIKAKSIIDCNYDKSSINKALIKLFSNKFKKTLKNITNPYGNGGASDKIFSIINNSDYSALIKKKFFNL